MSAGCERMSASGPGIFFDGKSSARHEVTVALDAQALTVRPADGGAPLVVWPFEQLEQVASSDGVLRLARHGGDDLARLEVRDPDLARAIDDLSIPVDRSGLTSRRSQRKVVFWSIAAVASLVLVGVFGVPQLATRLTPFVPYAVEMKLGEAVDRQARATFGNDDPAKPFECGAGEKERAGGEALKRLVRRLEGAAGLPIPLTVTVIRKNEANAVALPGGHVYVFGGLIDKAANADEVAGVIAHEIGHVAHRDGTRTVLQGAGLSFLFGMVLGDFVGGGAVVFGTKAVLQLAYSRDVEAAADRYGIDLMQKAGGDARALATILDRIAGKIEPGIKILLDHPATKERVAAIRRAAGSAGGSILEASDWTALKTICGKA
ncbi:MAG: M48 family metallopeptidase [Variibacter sp.]